MSEGVRCLAVREWATSYDGRCWYEQARRRLHGSTTKGQVALSVTALLSYEWLSGSIDKSLAVTSYSHMDDFGSKLMAGKALEDRREAWRLMACSIRRFLGESYVPCRFTDTFTEGIPQFWPHGMVEMYRICAGDDVWVSLDGPTISKEFDVVAGL